MRKGFVFGLFVLAAVAFAGPALAGLPCAAYSTCVMDLSIVSSCPTADLVWCPGGDKDAGIIRVTVRDCLELPIEACTVRLDLSGGFESNVDVGANVHGLICGDVSSTATTDANGAVSFTLVGGGAGAFFLNWTVTAECATPEVELCANNDTLCIKSFDFNGSGNVNFFDTFKYLPLLNGAAGYSADFTGCDATNLVNFFDTFQYLPHLNGAHACAAASFQLTDETGVLQCDDIH